MKQADDLYKIVKKTPNFATKQEVRCDIEPLININDLKIKEKIEEKKEVISLYTSRGMVAKYWKDKRLKVITLELR